MAPGDPQRLSRRPDRVLYFVSNRTIHAREGFVMPTYEYLCKRCGERFSQTMSVSEHDKHSVHCPKCGTAEERGEVAQQLSAFFAQTAKKS
jgi:putative FmdB family regulatory protein